MVTAGEDDDTSAPDQAASDQAVVDRAFGEDNRRRLIDQHFDQHGSPTVDDAWKHVYRLLLWTDRTTGLAHCYESDKSQPGRHWYSRSLRFHDWLSNELEVQPGGLADHIDRLFRSAVEDIAAGIADSRRAAAAKQRKPYEGRGFPEPGEDPELEDIVLDTLEPWLAGTPPPETMRSLTQRVHAYVGQENKRKNLLGEGFEDVLHAVVTRLALPGVTATTRAALHDLGGFYEPRHGEKPKVVDLAVDRSGRRGLVSAKWSVRADREEQFLTDHEAYSRLERAGEPWDYWWLTNEFDAARLVKSCDRMVGNAPMFTSVVHIALDGVMATYGDKLRGAQKRLPALIAERRLVSLSDWLRSLGEPAG